MELTELTEETTLEELAQLAIDSNAMLEKLRKRAMKPSDKKDLKFRVGVVEAAELLRCSPARVRQAEEDGRLPPPATSETGRRLGYTVHELWNIREALDLKGGRPENSEPVCIAFQNFKGGVGKSTTTVHCAHHLALQGMKVLVIDCDSQATTTTLFGLDPHLGIDRSETLYPFLAVDQTETDLFYAVKPTAWPNIDIIPAAQTLYEVEYELAAIDEKGDGVLGPRFLQLKSGLRDLAEGYDVVLLDPPPALGTISLAVMQAANALIVPLAATLPDYASTAHFTKMLHECATQLVAAGISINYKFVKMLITKFDSNDTSQSLMKGNILSRGFPGRVLDVELLQSTEISNAFLRWNSVYELAAPIGAPKTHKRCRSNLDSVFAQVDALVRKHWTTPVEIKQPVEA